MPTVRIVDLPPDALAVRRRRAAQAGKSLEDYLRARLVEMAQDLAVEEILDRASAEQGVGTDRRDRT